MFINYKNKIILSEKTTTVTSTTTRTKRSDGKPEEEEEPIFETIEGIEPNPEIKQGFWQFEERSSWQAVANPYPIQ